MHSGHLNRLSQMPTRSTKYLSDEFPFQTPNDGSENPLSGLCVCFGDERIWNKPISTILMKHRVLGRPIVVCTIRARQAREKETVLRRLHAKIDEQVSHTSASNVAEIQLGVVPEPYFLIWISPFPDRQAIRI
jgi:hypothetical protein